MDLYLQGAPVKKIRTDYKKLYHDISNRWSNDRAYLNECIDEHRRRSAELEKRLAESERVQQALVARLERAYEALVSANLGHETLVAALAGRKQ